LRSTSGSIYLPRVRSTSRLKYRVSNQRRVILRVCCCGFVPNGKLLATLLHRLRCNFSTDQAEFSTFRRLTLLLSIFMTIFLCCLIIYGPPKLKLRDGFAKVEEYDFYFEMIWIGLASSLITFLVHGALIWLFRFIPTLSPSTFDSTLFRNSGTNRRFSSRTTKICWVFLISNTISSMTVLIILGFWMPIITGWLWLTSVVVAILAYFFILEKIYDIISHFYSKNEENVLWIENLKKFLGAIEAQRIYLFRKFGENVLRPYFSHVYKPMSNEEIKVRLDLNQTC
jgi:hypothetical protein